jgi:hypothetical protein
MVWPSGKARPSEQRLKEAAAEAAIFSAVNGVEMGVVVAEFLADRPGAGGRIGDGGRGDGSAWEERGMDTSPGRGGLR